MQQPSAKELAKTCEERRWQENMAACKVDRGGAMPHAIEHRALSARQQGRAHGGPSSSNASNAAKALQLWLSIVLLHVKRTVAAVWQGCAILGELQVARQRPQEKLARGGCSILKLFFFIVIMLRCARL